MNPNAKEIVKQKLSIESVVGSYVKLEKSGKNFKACCPFHNEKTASFQVTPDRGIFYCFGCQKGGDIFTFVQEIEGVSFIDALKSLADKAGVSLDGYDGEKPSRLSVLREIMDVATKHYEVGLRQNAAVVEYLMGRGMTKDTMVSFRVGYAERGWSNLYDLLKRKHYADEDIIATGLCIKGPKGTYDRFRERIMFPISDGQGRVIAFTGRVMPGTEEASRPVGKYINSPETDLYHKSSVLFGFDKAKTAIHAEGFAIIVEGQMDCVMSHQAGVINVVALSGTASTDEHMKQIERFTTNVALCLDADKAGLAAAQKTAMVAYQHGMKVLVIDLSEEGGAASAGGSQKDPADLIKENADAWKEIISHRKDFVTFRLEKMKQRGEMDDKIAIAEKELFPVLAHMQSQILLDGKLQEIAHAFGSSTVEPVRAEFEKYRAKNPAAPSVISATAAVTAKLDETRKHFMDRMLGILLVLGGDEAARPTYEPLRESFNTIVAPFDNAIAPLLETDRAQLMVQTEHVLGTLPDSLPTMERTFKDLITRYEIRSIDEEKQQLDKEIVNNPLNVDAQKKVHALQLRKDALIRSLVNS